MKLNYSLDDMRLFWVVAQSSSFKQAATILSIPLSTLSRRISRLETALQLRLLHRDAHKISLTATGKVYFERCGSLFSELNDISGELHADKHQPKGKIRIAAPHTLTTYQLSKIFNQFLRQYPEIDIDLSLSNNNIDVEAHHIDIVIRAGLISLDNWVARPLTSLDYILCCSTTESQWQQIDEPEQLMAMPVVISKPLVSWHLQHRDTHNVKEMTPGRNIRLAVDDVEAVSQALVDGVGVGLLPTFVAQPLIEKGTLMNIAPRWFGRSRPVYLLYRDRNNLPLRVYLLIDFLLAAYE